MDIFVSVGTHPQPFNRLLKELNRLIEKKRLKAGVFAQIGNSTYEPKNYEFERFVDDEHYQKLMAEADVIISHGGAGTIINALRLKKELVVVPRLEKFGEHTNDHQLDLARALESQGKCLAVYKISDLGKKINESISFEPVIASNRAQLIKRIKRFIEQK